MNSSEGIHFYENFYIPTRKTKPIFFVNFRNPAWEMIYKFFSVKYSFATRTIIFFEMLKVHTQVSIVRYELLLGIILYAL